MGGLYGHIFIDSKNGLWVIPEPFGGATVCYREGKNRTGKRTVIPSGNVFSISENKEGRIWVFCWLIDFLPLAADGSSLTGMHQAAFRFSQLQTLRPSGTMILYTVANGIYKFGEPTVHPVGFSLLPNPISLIIDRNNTYWIGTYNTGLVHYDPRTQWLGGLIYRQD